MGQMKGRNYSGAVVMYNLPVEGDSTSAMILQARSLADAALPGPHYWIGESEMYQELQEGFPSELLLLTLLTVLSIFVIVALTFHSLFIPVPLVITILSGIYVNIWASGLGGNTMYYLSYLIIQSILMGATIDYTILITHYYLDARREADIPSALTEAYKGSSHSILTSGLILIIVPYVMSLIMKDPMIASILSSLSMGSLAVVLLILFVLPGVIAALDPLFKRRKAQV
jgi:Predicted exporters of the RND superfamily